MDGVQVHLGSVGFSWDGGVVCTWEAGRPSPAWSTLGSQRSQKWWARKRPTALAANHGLIFKFVAQDPRIRTHHSVNWTKTDRGMIWLILGFFLPPFCSLPYLNTSLVGLEHEWILFYIGTVALFNQVNPARNCSAPHRTLLHCCAPDVSDLWQKCPKCAK